MTLAAAAAAAAAVVEVARQQTHVVCLPRLQTTLPLAALWPRLRRRRLPV